MHGCKASLHNPVLASFNKFDAEGDATWGGTTICVFDAEVELCVDYILYHIFKEKK